MPFWVHLECEIDKVTVWTMTFIEECFFVKSKAILFDLTSFSFDNRSIRRTFYVEEIGNRIYKVSPLVF